MTMWQHIETECRVEWNAWAGQLADTLVFQTWEWGELKQQQGWKLQRFVAHGKGGKVIAMAQTLCKHLPGGIRFVWIPGGPLELAPVESRTELYEDFTAAVAAVVGGCCYIRCSFMIELTGTRSFDMARCMLRPLVRLNSGYSIMLNLAAPEAEWLPAIDSKHRYYVKKSRGAELTWRYGDGEDLLAELARLSEQMIKDKVLGPQGTELDGLLQLRAAIPFAPRVLIGYLDNEAVTACLILRFGQSAFYASAATVGRGREVSAAYAMVAELRRHLRDEGVLKLDFGGIDPIAPGSRGVTHFKSGFGGKVVEYLGEWDWATAPWVRWLSNLALKVKKG